MIPTERASFENRKSRLNNAALHYRFVRNQNRGSRYGARPGCKASSLSLAFLMILSFVLLLPAGNASATSTWTKTTNYPIRFDGGSCVAHGGYVFCVGGHVNSTYYAPLSSSGIGTWTKTTSYPTYVTEQSCAAFASYVYCVGGFNGTGFSRSTYYARISSSGIGKWVQTTSYPVTPLGPFSCVTNSGYLYCVGGSTAAAFYAPISGSGVGNWIQTSSYPFALGSESCVASSGNMYCVGGLTTLNQRNSSVYYAPVSSSGIGGWTKTKHYPTPIGEGSCAAFSATVYCVGGSTNKNPYGIDLVYYAPLKHSGVGAWRGTTSYPTTIAIESCVASAQYMYCIGGAHNGATNSTYYMGLP